MVMNKREKRTPKRRTNNNNNHKKAAGAALDEDEFKTEDNSNRDQLPEDHTIADSVTMIISAYEGDLGEDDDDIANMIDLDDYNDDDDDDDGDDDDMLLAHGGGRRRRDLVDADNNHTTTTTTRGGRRRSRVRDAIATMEEFTSEKRSAQREARLRHLFKILSQCATGRSGHLAVAMQQDTLYRAFAYSLRSGIPPSEQYAACRCTEVTAIVLGGGGMAGQGRRGGTNTTAPIVAWMESVAPLLQRAVEGTTRATAVRMAALRAWALAVFMVDAAAAATGSEASLSDQGYGTEQLMNFCELAAQPTFRNETTPLALRATAWDTWALLATTMEDVYLAGTTTTIIASEEEKETEEEAGNNDEDDDSENENIHTTVGRGLVVLSWLRECLDVKSLDVREAAGECLSLIHEARLNLGRDGIGEEGDDDGLGGGGGNGFGNVTEKHFSPGSWNGTPWEVTMDEIQQRIAELAVESDRAWNKKARKEQRATFREFVHTIVDDEGPDEVVVSVPQGGNNSHTTAQILTLSTWREIIVLNFVRHCLQGGFQIQLFTNETLQSLFLGGGGGGGADHWRRHRRQGPTSTASAGGASLSALEKRLYRSKGSEAAKEAHADLTRRRDKRENIKNHFLTVDD